jgi:hypothetical protein
MTGPRKRIQLLHPDPDKSAPRIDLWKYRAVKSAILLALSADPTVRFSALPDIVRTNLSPDEVEKLGSVSWYTTSVKLDLEARGLLERIPGSRPQALRLIRQMDEPNPGDE